MCNHHHQPAPGSFSLPTRPLAALDHCPAHSDTENYYHRHLESLLDAALATLSLLQDASYCPSITYTLLVRTTNVLRALASRVLAAAPTPAPTTPAPTPDTTLPLDAPNTSAHATLMATDLPRQSQPVPPQPNKDKRPSAKHRGISHPADNPPSVILRFDQEPNPPTIRADPLALYIAIRAAFHPLPLRFLRPIERRTGTSSSTPPRPSPMHNTL
jgi:hypothetical protein